MATLTAHVTLARNGHLECRDCGMGTYWCNHIQNYIQKGEDAHDLWKTSAEIYGLRIQVPYVPTLGQWALVEIGTEHFGSYKLYLHLDFEGKVNINTGEPDTEFLGFISPGDGRRVMREMVHAWFLPRLTEKNQCISASHNFKAQMQWDREVTNSDPSKKEYLAQVWSVHFKGMCLRCAAVSETAGTDDLVPDVRTGRRSWGSR